MGKLPFIVAVLVMIFVSGQTLAEKRVALVIGNNDYSSLPDLNNAKNPRAGGRRGAARAIGSKALRAASTR